MKSRNVIRTVMYVIASLLVLLMLSACSKVSFEVDFVVDGETVHTVNTNGSEVIKLPDNPTKEGYEFKGWYWDENLWKKPFTANSLLEEPLTGDMKVYARFEKAGTSAIETLPVPGTAYRLFIDQENAGFRCYLSGNVDGYNLGTTINASEAVNVYVEESDLSGKYKLFCVKDGKRLYINIENNGTIYHPVFSNVASTLYEYNLARKTFVGSVDGNDLVLGTNSSGNFRRIDARHLHESSFLAHLAISDTPDATIPDVEVSMTNIATVHASGIGLYKVVATVVGVNAQSFLIEDESGRILVYRGSSWTPDVKEGDVVTLEGKSAVYAGFKQFSVDATYTVTGSDTVSRPEPKVLTVTDLENYAANGFATIDYVTLGGVVAISGPYVNIVVDGTTVMGAYSYPIADLSAYTGKYVEIDGYVTSITGSSVRYVNILATGIREATKPDTPILPNPPVSPDTPTTPTVTETNIAGILAGEIGVYRTSGTVIAVNAQSFLMKDATGTILVYKGSTWTPDVKVGDVVTAEGTSGVHSNTKQLTKDTTYTVTGTAQVTQPTPTVLKGADLDAYSAQSSFTPTYVKLTGVLTVSGYYYNLAVDGTTVMGSIAYPTTDLTAYNGKTVEVVGYFIYMTGSAQRYFNVIATSVTEVTQSAPETPVIPTPPTPSGSLSPRSSQVISECTRRAALSSPSTRSPSL